MLKALKLSPITAIHVRFLSLSLMASSEMDSLRSSNHLKMLASGDFDLLLLKVLISYLSLVNIVLFRLFLRVLT